MTNIVWFRQDLRLSDNPALSHAAGKGEPIVGLYVLDETAPPSGRALGGASRWWLHRSLESLGKSLESFVLLRGDPLELVSEFANSIGANGIYWNRCYEPYAITRDTALKAKLTDSGIEAASFNGSLLSEPWQVQTQTGAPYKVYSAYWRAALKRDIAQPTPAPDYTTATIGKSDSDRLEDWGLIPTRPNWAATFEDHWEPGEAGAQQRLQQFLMNGLKGYGTLRDRPDKENVSRLSPHLHFGEISPRQIWTATQLYADRNPEVRKDADKFLAEIGWREFSYHLMYHFPELTEKNWKPAFDAYPWAENNDHLAAWQQGRTGYPIVDAGMRELWATGYMHNRVRMVAASFLVKHLKLHWKHGEEWFWDTLVDADLANNSASWQWVAGSGADAAPYFRIFNPMTQGRKFDPDGAYVRQWCPELASLPNSVLHAPFEASAPALEKAGVVLGKSYPLPIVNHATARAEALAGYECVKAASAA